ncbi:type II toxin-antitoxin system RatA family toxin [Reinekea sp.]|jgi:ribosome-associated toxin RatA of RatAB toxin-antitoxin module|uniref:type II toxin-antitoxin system RatA family toxin n=1 Tax=Reinekea sp. TaxID=1970455 RepID=UPI002A7FAA62|nr:type II toxin-antitoxin system RatA family toxin [Reinekea sp.]
MIEIHRSALVLVSAEQLYDLITDIEQYPEFLDGVVAARVLETGASQMLGQLTVRKAGFERTLVTRNTLVRPVSIEMNLAEGPLESLTGLWQIKELGPSGCKVTFDLTFNAGQGLKATAFALMFKQIADAMVSSFVARAHGLSP